MCIFTKHLGHEIILVFQVPCSFLSSLSWWLPHKLVQEPALAVERGAWSVERELGFSKGCNRTVSVVFSFLLSLFLCLKDSATIPSVLVDGGSINNMEKGTNPVRINFSIIRSMAGWENQLHFCHTFQKLNKCQHIQEVAKAAGIHPSTVNTAYPVKSTWTVWSEAIWLNS